MNWLSIDFGTSECSAAFVDKNGELKSVVFTSPNSSTKHDFPTVAWKNQDGSLFVGYEAESQSANNPANYIFEFKLELENQLNDNIIGVNNVTYTDVVTAILSKIKQEAESAVNGSNAFPNVVITVPVDFKPKTIKKIKNAAQQAGFKKVETVMEPQAAAIYFNEKATQFVDEEEFTALIYDMGGGTFDPAIIKVTKDSTGIDYDPPINGSGTKKAGKYFDKMIRDRFINDNPIPNNEHRSKINRELQKKCKEAKHMLTGCDSTAISVNYRNDGDKNLSISREDFKEMIGPAVQESITKCHELIDREKLKWNDIKVIFFVGGSCNIPYIRECVRGYAHNLNNNIQTVWNEFKGANLEPQYAVSLGGALYIDYLEGRKKKVEEKKRTKEEVQNKDNEENEEQLDYSHSINCKNPECKSPKCYKMFDRIGYYHCIECGWEGRNITVKFI